MAVKIIAYSVVVRDEACPTCGHGKTWTVLGPANIEGSTSYGEEADAIHEADILNRAFQLGINEMADSLQKEVGKRSVS